MASLQVQELAPDLESSAEYNEYCLILGSEDTQFDEASCVSIDDYQEAEYETSTQNNNSSSAGGLSLWLLILLLATHIVKRRGICVAKIRLYAFMTCYNDH